MQVSTYVREAVDEMGLYSSLTLQPDVAAAFLPTDAPVLGAFARSLDVSFLNLVNQPCGYYQMKRLAAASGSASLLSFVEDATEYRLTREPGVRLAR